MDDEGYALLHPAGGGGDWRQTVLVGGSWETDGTLAASYLEAAQILAEHAATRHRNDLIALPALNLYRHAIELALKDAIRATAESLRREGTDDPELDAERLNLQLTRSHSIGGLADILSTLLERLGLGAEQQLPARTLEILKGLHLLDSTGQAFRYSTVKEGSGRRAVLVPARPDLDHFDLSAAAAALHDAATMVLYGVSGVLDAREEHRMEMLREFGGWAY